MSGLIAIVGRPNVGKSALFNRIVGRRIAIVHDQPGVTRDRISAEAEWHGRPFTLVDTGGIGLFRGETADDTLSRAALTQVEVAIEAAQVIILVVDAQQGLVALDHEVAKRLRVSEHPVLVAINKVDLPHHDSQTTEFAELGFGQTFPVSAIHNRGIESLMEAALAHLPPSSAAQRLEEEAPLRLAIVGRPNVGKSSLINSLTRSERVIVSPIPGTTRDSIDIPFEVQTEGQPQKYVLIDTAGIRKERRIDNSIEFFSVKRAEDSIERSDVVLFVLDAESGILEQDKKIADKIVEASRACILIVNKWDLFQQTVEQARMEQIARAKKRGRNSPPSSLAEFAAWVQRTLFFLDYAPVIFTSAHSGFNLDRLLEAIRFVTDQLRQQVPTSLLNRTLHDAVEQRQPPSRQGHRLKFFYATQTRKNPATFRLFLNRSDLLSEQYRKYLADQLRRAFGYEGCPIRLEGVNRPRTIESVSTPPASRTARSRRHRAGSPRRSLRPGPRPD